MLDAEQIQFYRENGYLLVEQAIEPDLLARLQRTTHELIDRSRTVGQSNDVYDLDEGHGPDNPRLTRIKLPHKQDPAYAEVLKSQRVIGCLRSLLGQSAFLQTGKLNTKAPGGGAAVEWHQDWAFYPATNDDLLAIGVMIDDVTADNGPLMVIPGSHKGPVLSHHNNGVFCGAIDPKDEDFHFDKAVTLTGKAGDMTVHHVRMLHGSAPNVSDRPRMILFYEVAAADAWPILGSGSYIHRLPQRELWEDLNERMLFGEPVLQPRIEPNPVRLPLPPAPDAGSIFKTQKSGGARSAFAA